jgi:hypothetical protein
MFRKILAGVLIAISLAAAPVGAAADGVSNPPPSPLSLSFLSQHMPGGFLNVFRNTKMEVAQRGASGLATTTTIASAPSYTLDGWIGYSFGAAATCKQSTTVPSGVGVKYALECDGVASNTDIKIGQRVESFMASPVAGVVSTLQFWYYQNTGSTVTPKIVECVATAADTWNGGTNKFDCANNSGATADLGATSLTACATATWCLETYTWTPNANAANGVEVDIDCNAAFASSSVKCMVAAPDFRPTPGMTNNAIAAAVPPPELRPIGVELAQSQRYLPAFTSGRLPGLGEFGDSSHGYFTVFFSIPTRVPVTGVIVGTVANIWATEDSIVAPVALSALSINGSVSVSAARIYVATATASFTAGYLFQLDMTPTSFYFTGAEL